MNYTGTAGNDNLIGTSANDVFTMTQGGMDDVAGGAGNDIFIFGAAFNVNDVVDGGTGIDTLKLDGDYSGAKQLDFNSSTIENIEKIVLSTGHSYTLQMSDNLGAGEMLSVTGAALGTSDVLSFQGGNAQDGNFAVAGGAGADILDGGAHNDHIVGGAGNDSIDGGDGGKDILDGGDGNDFIDLDGGIATVLGGAGDDFLRVNNVLVSTDRIDGGDGFDTLTLSQSASVNFKATTMVNVESINLVPGHSYSLTTADANVGAGQTLDIAGSQLGVGDTLTFNGSHELDGSFSIVGGAGNDVLTGGAQNDVFDPGAGSDIVRGGKGSDLILMGANLDASDRIDGNDGVADEVQLDGDYSMGLVMQPNTLEYIDILFLAGGHSYKLTTSDGTVEDGRTMTVDASQVGSGDSFAFNAIKETDSSYVITAGMGDATITGGAMADTINLGNGNSLTPGGIDNIKAGGGDDVVTITNFFDVHSRIDGGAGNDVVNFEVSSNSAFHFGTATLLNVETLDIKNVTFTAIAVRDQAVAAGQTLTVDGSTLNSASAGVTNHFSFDGSAETDGKFLMLGGDGNDVLMGGAGNDSFTGGAGADSIAGGGGDNIFVYANAAQSDGSLHDTITGADMLNDKFDFAFTVTAVDATVASGALSTATFDSDMTAALGASHLGVHHAVVFTPTSGDLAGHTFLVVDANGTAGYQANQDFVIELASTHHLASLGTGNFI